MIWLLLIPFALLGFILWAQGTWCKHLTPECACFDQMTARPQHGKVTIRTITRKDIPMSSVKSHLHILEGLEASDAPALKLPKIDCNGLDILDIGCGIGQHLLAPQFANARSLHGIDIDPEPIHYASQVFPKLHLRCAPAEAIPYPACHFDLVYSSVSIPYTRIRATLAEVFRVTRPGGTVWMSLHGIEMELLFTWSVIRRRKVKDLIKRAYVWCNGIYFSLTGDTFYRPGSQVMESFQLKGAMRRAMQRAGFVDIEFDTDGYKLLVQARRPK